MSEANKRGLPLIIVEQSNIIEALIDLNKEIINLLSQYMEVDEYEKQLNTLLELSYMGWFSSTDTYDVFSTRIKPYVNIRAFKQRISRYDKKRGGINLKCQTA